MLKGKNIYLRPLLVEDAKDYHKAILDPEIRYMTGTKKIFSLEEIENHIKEIRKDHSREDYAICSLETGLMLGELSLLDLDLDNRSVSFRIALNHQNHLNKGLGSEAIKLVIDYVFETKKLNRLQLEVYSHNKRGIKAYEKCGFKKEGVLRQALYFNESYFDEIIMAMVKDDWLKIKKA